MGGPGGGACPDRKYCPGHSPLRVGGGIAGPERWLEYLAGAERVIHFAQELDDGVVIPIKIGVVRMRLLVPVQRQDNDTRLKTLLFDSCISVCTKCVFFASVSH